jgi:hypothetical protein
MSYNPADDEPTGVGGIHAALAEAERRLTHRTGVKGMGISKTPSGEDAIVVYVQDEQTLSQLPSDVDGVPLVGEVTGEIRAL